MQSRFIRLKIHRRVEWAHGGGSWRRSHLRLARRGALSRAQRHARAGRARDRDHRERSARPSSQAAMEEHLYQLRTAPTARTRDSNQPEPHDAVHERRLCSSSPTGQDRRPRTREALDEGEDVAHVLRLSGGQPRAPVLDQRGTTHARRVGDRLRVRWARRSRLRDPHETKSATRRRAASRVDRSAQVFERALEGIAQPASLRVQGRRRTRRGSFRRARERSALGDLVLPPRLSHGERRRRIVRVPRWPPGRADAKARADAPYVAGRGSNAERTGDRIAIVSEAGHGAGRRSQ